MDLALIGKHREIVQDLIQKLPAFAPGDKKQEWTSTVKQVMHQLCQDHTGKDVADCYATISDVSWEWMLDVLWYAYGEQGQEWVLLGLESEWNDRGEGIVWDFRRLLATKAPIKIMLFEARGSKPEKSKKRRDEVIETLNAAARAWAQHAAEDHFYAIDFSHGSHASYYCQIRSDGRDENFAFELLPELSGDD